MEHAKSKLTQTRYSTTSVTLYKQSVSCTALLSESRQPNAQCQNVHLGHVQSVRTTADRQDGEEVAVDQWRKKGRYVMEEGGVDKERGRQPKSAESILKYTGARFIGLQLLHTKIGRIGGTLPADYQGCKIVWRTAAQMPLLAQ